MFEQLEQLETRRASVLEAALATFEAEDWPGCASAMMDLREIDAVLTLLRTQPSESPHVHSFVYEMAHDHEACACGETRPSGSGRTDQRQRRADLEYALLIAVLEDWLLHQDRHEAGIDAAGVRAQLATLKTFANTR